MCGIVGVVSSSPQKTARDREKFFRTALIVDQIRGFHSTGFFKVAKPFAIDKGTFGDVTTIKRAFCANDFLDLKSVDNALTANMNAEIMIGHNRWATMGGIAHHTAHPFTHGDITLVHNGTLHWFQDLPGSSDFDIDSEAIAYALSTVPPEDAKKILETLDGAYALVWYDARIGKLRAARNDERPLHFVYSHDNKDLLLASEAGMLEWLAHRHDFKPQEVWQLKEGCILTLDREDLTDYEVEKFDIYDDGYGGWGNYNYGKYNQYHAKLEDKSKDKGKKPSEDSVNPLKEFGLRPEDKICFDPHVFEFYPGNENKKRKWGKLVGEYKTPKEGLFLKVECDGLLESQFSDMVGYSIQCEVQCGVLVTGEFENKNIEQMVIKCRNPQYVLDDGDGDTDDVEPVLLGADGTPIEDDCDRYGPFNTIITESRWFELKDNGCSMCGGDIGDDEDDITGWDSTGQPICHHCLEQNNWANMTPNI